jgi:putative lipoprotein
MTNGSINRAPRQCHPELAEGSRFTEQALMHAWLKILPLLFALLTAGCASSGFANDNWLGRDKFHHFWVSGLISGAATETALQNGNDNPESLAIAVGVTFTIGAAKEWHDCFFGTTGWSWKDLCWDIAGSLTGYALVTALD